MNELAELLGGLPPWAQLLGLLLLGGLAVGLRRRNSARSRSGGSRSGTPRSSRPRSSQQRSSAPAVLRSDRSDGSDPSAAHAQDPGESPGRWGDEATRDLTSAEIRRLEPSYAPEIDGEPDPGEIVWTWVPYAENDGRGKDRPVLIIARIDDETFAGCYLSTKQHRGFVSVGTGGWDAQGRESFLAPDRVLRVHADGMRREGHVLSKDRFVRAVQAVAAYRGAGG